MEIRWLGEVELTFNPSFLPFPCPYIHGKKTPGMSRALLKLAERSLPLVLLRGFQLLVNVLSVCFL